MSVTHDPPSDYECVAGEFMRRRGPGGIGAATVREWTRRMRRGSAVLDLGCGHGVPISQVLVDEGFDVYGIDSSPSMIGAFQKRFPSAHAECAPVETSDLFGRSFDGIVSWGLLFLLLVETQERLIGKVATALAPGGQFVFTSTLHACTWTDILTGTPSISLGGDRYRAILAREGLEIVGEASDEGDNHYYFALKR